MYLFIKLIYCPSHSKATLKSFVVRYFQCAFHFKAYERSSCFTLISCMLCLNLLDHKVPLGRRKIERRLTQRSSAVVGSCPCAVGLSQSPSGCKRVWKLRRGSPNQKCLVLSINSGTTW